MMLGVGELKKAILAVVTIVVAGMIGWTVYDFAASSEDEPEEELGGASITSPSSDEDDEDETDTSDEVGFDIGNKAPDFELETLDGETEKLSDYIGERVIVNFWATWCPPCREEIPAFKKLYKNRDVEILAIDLEETEESMDDVEAFVDEFEMAFPVLRDKDSDVATTYQVMAYPTSYMVDSEGYIQFKAMGAMEYEQMEKRVDEMD